MQAEVAKLRRSIDDGISAGETLFLSEFGIQQYEADLNALTAELGRYPFDNVLVSEFQPDGFDVRNRTEVIATDICDEFFSSLKRAPAGAFRLFHESCTASSLPFGWDLPDLPSHPDAEVGAAGAKLAGILSERGVAGGYCIPVRCPGGQNAFAVFFSAYPQKGIDYPDIIIPVIRFVENTVLDIRDRRLTKSELTGREIECLRWAAAGKTSVELARIVGLSENTVNHYLHSATRKLDSVSRTQAVVKLIRYGFA